MKKHNILTFILLASFIVSCNKTEEDNFSINEEKLKVQYTINDAVSLEVLRLNEQKIDSVVFHINDKIVGASKGINEFLFH